MTLLLSPLSNFTSFSPLHIPHARLISIQSRPIKKKDVESYGIVVIARYAVPYTCKG
jgi:hypothetical protein